MPLSNKCVAKLCLNLCGETFFLISAFFVALSIIFCIFLGVNVLFLPGNKNSSLLSNVKIYFFRSSINKSDNLKNLSLEPLPFLTHPSFLSMLKSFNLKFINSETLKPVEYKNFIINFDLRFLVAFINAFISSFVNTSGIFFSARGVLKFIMFLFNISL